MESLWIYFFIMLFGFCIGSFLNICSYRLPRGHSLLTPCSCPDCGTKLRILDLLPVFRRLCLRPRCRCCGTVFPWRHLVVELSTALLFAASYQRFGANLFTLESWLLVSFLLLISIIDYDWQLILDKLLFYFVCSGLALRISEGVFRPFETILAVALGGGLLLLIALASRGGMGGGDVKFAAALGCWFGWKALLLLLLLAFVSGGMAGLFLLASGLKKRKDAVPFGPFLCLAAWIVAWYGDLLSRLLFW